MRIALDGTPLLISQTGVGRYTRELGRALGAYSPELKVNYLYGIHGLYRLRQHLSGSLGRSLPERPLVAGNTPGPRWARCFPEDLKQRLKIQAARLECRMRRPEIYHATNFISERWECPVVATIHDLSFIRYPQTHPQARLDWIRQGLPHTLARAHLITVSHFTKHELMTLLQVPEERISVVHEGIDSRFKPLPRNITARRLKRYQLQPGAYILSVGTLEPRKNIIRLLQAYERLPDALARRYPLVVAGLGGWKDAPIHTALRRLSDRGRLRALGFVTDDNLPALYNGAALFVFPSLYEGFGFPPLEAMACGTAALVSNRASLPEVVGQGAMLVDPESIEAITEAMNQLLEDPSLRETLAARGVAQARRFTWENCALETLAVYRRWLQDN
ncbi:MAG: glycosyltransferase family 1 protein [Desulfobacterales bacterium]